MVASTNTKNEKNEVYELMRAVLQMGRRLRSNRDEHAPSIAVMSVLSTLQRSGPLPTGELARRERLAPQSMARLVAELARCGFASCEHNPLDRRQTLVRVTVKGLRALQHEMQVRSTWLDAAIAAQLSENERADLIAATKLLQRVAAYEP